MIERIAPTEPLPPAQSALAAASIVVAMVLVAIGNGLMFAYIPVRLGAGGYAPTWAGTILTSLSLGGIAGCLLTGPLVRRVGHARAFMVSSATIVLSNSMLAVAVDPMLWIAARALYGFGICGLFIISQSWLNDSVGNAVRGRVMAIFYVAYVIGLGVGAYLLKFLDLQTPIAPLVGIVFAALSILPIGLTRLPQPAAQPGASVAFRRAWATSPVGMAGMLAVGGLSMLIAGFAPIHATAIGFSQGQVATLMFAMPLGTLIFQIPLGWISDRTDRRYVLIAASILVALAGLVASMAGGAALPVLIAIYVVWSGASDSLYSLSNAHANDRAAPGDHVTLSSSMLFSWSIAGFIAPALGTALTGRYGTQSFMYIAICIAVAFALFVAWRVTRAAPAIAGAALAPLTGRAPLPVANAPSSSASGGAS